MHECGSFRLISDDPLMPEFSRKRHTRFPARIFQVSCARIGSSSSREGFNSTWSLRIDEGIPRTLRQGISEAIAACFAEHGIDDPRTEIDDILEV